MHDTQTAWFGALGGVSIGIYGIYDHIRKRDFDPKYIMWYLCKPVIGAIFGWFAYLVISSGTAVDNRGGQNFKPPTALRHCLLSRVLRAIHYSIN